MNKPVFVFTGFLDAGKSSAIIASMQDKHFNDGTKTLLICLEEGEVSYSADFANKVNAHIVHLDSSELTHEKMTELEENYDFERIVIECNGSVDLNQFIETGFIQNWELVEVMCFIDTTTFSLYFNNMRQLFYNYIINSQVVIFNRYNNQDKKQLRTAIKSINPRCQIIYENLNNQIEADQPGDLFDLSKDHLEITDLDFGMWYIDSLDNPKKYENKKITIQVKLTGKLQNRNEIAFFGRKAMVCCEDDIADISVLVAGINVEEIDPNQYYQITGIAHIVQDTNNDDRIILYLEEIRDCDAPAVEIVNFN